MSVRSRGTGISANPVWLSLTQWERPQFLLDAIAIGTADQVCPRCGRAEKFHHYCSLCFRPTQLADVRIHPPADTHGCVFKRVPPDARNGGWGDKSVGPWTPEEGVDDSATVPIVRGVEAESVGSSEGA